MRMFIMTYKRIISIDLGNKVTGITVADSYDDVFVVLHVDVIDTTDIMIQTSKIIKEFGYGDCLLVLENIFMYRNFALHKIHKNVRDVFKAKGIKYRCLMPSQKSYDKGKRLKVSRSKERKNLAIAGAVHLLDEVLNDTENLAKFHAFQPRNHDLADALMMAFYVHESG